MGTDFGDYDRDGDMDLFVTILPLKPTRFTKTTAKASSPSPLGGLGLGEVSLRPLGFGTRFFDYDNDRDLDLFVANGHVMDVSPNGIRPNLRQTNPAIPQRGRPTLRRRLYQYGPSLRPSQCPGAVQPWPTTTTMAISTC